MDTLKYPRFLYLTVNEACQLFETSRWTFRRMMKLGNISGQKIGKEKYYLRSEITHLLTGIAEITIVIEIGGKVDYKIFQSEDLESQVTWLENKKKLAEKNDLAIKYIRL